MSTPTATPPATARSTKPGRDGRQVEHRFVLEPRAVRDRQREIPGDDERELGAGEERERDREDLEDDRARDRHAHRDVARRDRPETLRRVNPVGLRVERVVQVVRAARGETEAHERDGRVAHGRGLVEHSCGPGCREHEHVLDPLLRPREAQQRAWRGLMPPYGRRVF